MKILIVTFTFPPSNVIGAVRVGKLARYLDARGHDVRVLTTDIIRDRSLPLEIARERVIYTDYRERKNWVERSVGLLRGRSNLSVGTTGGCVPVQHAGLRQIVWETLRRQYCGLVHIPDMRVDWMRTAVPAGMRLIEQWRPDIMFASAPPYTGFVVTSRLARSFGIPWVADFRDLWVDNPYYIEPSWRRPLDAVLERLTLRNAAGLVTVSPAWAAQLQRRHSKAVQVVYNGYAEEDFPPLPVQTQKGKVIIIRYVGSIYHDFRDPSALFAAIALLPAVLRTRVMVEFYGDFSDVVLGAASAHGITDVVAARPRVPYRRALELQIGADVLLLLQCSTQRDEGNLPAKLFEYLYARRPILLIGYEHGIAAQLINERGAGLVSNDPLQICDQLQVWLAEKEMGRLGPLAPSVSLGLSRDEQYRKIEDLFAKILDTAMLRMSSSRTGSRLWYN
jgi:glycosyltransferase involved in cell wall biosynthesis